MAESLGLCDIKDVQHQLLWLPSWYLTQLGISLCFSNLKAALFPVCPLLQPLVSSYQARVDRVLRNLSLFEANVEKNIFMMIKQ